jgi:tetraacyldisaccharide 4'-kinase
VTIESSYKKLVSGEAKGIGAALACAGLQILSWPYRLAIGLRSSAYGCRLLSVHKVGVPVISVGNLTTGGTGKTPVVAWICEALQQAGHQPAIVSRGYKADATGTNDEKRVLQRLCPSVPHQQNADRVAAAEKVQAESDVDVIVLDDGFQHRRMHRDLNVVLIDATNPFGFGHLLPRGLLREPLRSLSRADVVLLTRTDMVSEAELSTIEDTVLRNNPALQNRFFRVSFQPTELLDSAGGRHPVSDVAGKTLSVMTAIGNPEGFKATCESLGAAIRDSHIFPDHHHYTSAELDAISAAKSSQPFVLTTLKDLVKIPTDAAAFRAVQIATVFADAQQQTEFSQLLNSTLEAVTEQTKESPADESTQSPHEPC